MGRRKKYDEERVQLALRIPEALYERLEKEAGARDLSVNFMINRAVAEFLPRLIPVSELRLTRDLPSLDKPE